MLSCGGRRFGGWAAAAGGGRRLAGDGGCAAAAEAARHRYCEHAGRSRDCTAPPFPPPAARIRFRPALLRFSRSGERLRFLLLSSRRPFEPLRLRFFPLLSLCLSLRLASEFLAGGGLVMLPSCPLSGTYLRTRSRWLERLLCSSYLVLPVSHGFQSPGPPPAAAGFVHL